MNNSQEKILFFVREPVPGTVKSRLGATIGTGPATELYRCFVLDMYETLATLGAQVVVCHHPPDAGDAFRQLLGPDTLCMPQEGSDLGQRMKRGLEWAFEQGAERAVLVGSDLPDLPAAHIAKAFDCLRTGHDAVLGPARDGGYYLIGFTANGFVASVFDGVDWGGPKVLDQTTSRLDEAAAQYALLPLWNDVDEIRDLLMLLQSANPSFFATRTHAALRDMEHVLHYSDPDAPLA